MHNRQPRREKRRLSWRKRFVFAAVAFAIVASVGIIALELVLRSQQGNLLGARVQLQGMFTDYGGTVLATPHWRGELTVEGRTVPFA